MYANASRVLMFFSKSVLKYSIDNHVFLYLYHTVVEYRLGSQKELRRGKGAQKNPIRRLKEAQKAAK